MNNSPNVTDSSCNTDLATIAKNLQEFEDKLKFFVETTKLKVWQNQSHRRRQIFIVNYPLDVYPFRSYCPIDKEAGVRKFLKYAVKLPKSLRDQLLIVSVYVMKRSSGTTTVLIQFATDTHPYLVINHLAQLADFNRARKAVFPAVLITTDFTKNSKSVYNNKLAEKITTNPTISESFTANEVCIEKEKDS